MRAIVAFVLGADWRESAVGIVAIGGGDDSREQIDGAGAGGAVLASDVVGLGVGRSGRGNVRSPVSADFGCSPKPASDVGEEKWG